MSVRVSASMTRPLTVSESVYNPASNATIMLRHPTMRVGVVPSPLRARYRSGTMANSEMSSDDIQAALDLLALDHSDMEIVGPARKKPMVVSDKQRNHLSLPKEPSFSRLTTGNVHPRFESVAHSPQPFESDQRPPAKKKAKVKEVIPDLPIYLYKDYRSSPALVLTRNEDETDDLIHSLRGPLGFDMEWRVFFGRGRQYHERRTAVIQLCDERMIMLIQISAMKRIPEKLKEVLESPQVRKIGANILNDGRKLYGDFGIACAGLVELGALARHADPEFADRYKRVLGVNAPPTRTIVSLAKMVALYEGKKLEKGAERTADWEAELGFNMQRYAANDVHCALVVHNNIISIAKQNSIKLDPQAYTKAVTENTISTAVPEQESAEHTTGECAPATGSELRPQHRRAYHLWHHEQTPLARMCAILRSEANPLKASTVISYVVSALKEDEGLPFSMSRLRELVMLEATSWTRHRAALASLQRGGRGV